MGKVLNKIFNEDCLIGMKRIPDGSVDMILTDLPYSVTQNHWDNIIPFEPLWEQYERVIKDNGAIVLTASGFFVAELMLSNEKWWKYNLVWDKVLKSGFLNANRMPLRQHEDICVFYKEQPAYNPQKTKGKPNHSRGSGSEFANNNYGDFDFVDNADDLGDMKHPTSILTFSRPHSSTMKHPTEKPVSLFEYLIKTYTNEGDTVLDSCMGSGTTAIACINTNRNYIGFELDEDYYKASLQRIEEHTRQVNIFDLTEEKIESEA